MPSQVVDRARHCGKTNPNKLEGMRVPRHMRGVDMGQRSPRGMSEQKINGRVRRLDKMPSSLLHQGVMGKIKTNRGRDSCVCFNRCALLKDMPFYK